MAEAFRANFDTSGIDRALSRLAGPMRESLARSMAVAGGKVLRDEAIARAPVGTEGESTNPGLLKSAIYLAHKDARSNEKEQVYSISWNSRKAPHGHLVEFGHWQEYATFKGDDGKWHTNRNVKLDDPRWVPAHPFLRPALAAWPAAKAAMIRRGRERLAELLAGTSGEVEPHDA